MQTSQPPPGPSAAAPLLHAIETVVSSESARLERLRVDGGWLYIASEEIRGGNSISLAMAFVPDERGAMQK
jgi:hypothetical protein